MSLDLDERQRAMLHEMGVHVWWPLETSPLSAQHAETDAPRQALVRPEAASDLAARAIEAAAAAAVSVTNGVEGRGEPTGTSLPPMGVPMGDVDGMDWATLAQSVASCQACPMGIGRRAPVFETNFESTQTDWLIVGDAPDDAEEQAGRALVGPAGQLFDNMLKALGAQRNDASDRSDRKALAHVTHVIKCRPGVPRAPTPEDLLACEGYLRREVQLRQPKVILAMGRLAAYSLLRESAPNAVGKPLGQLRGTLYQFHGVPVVVSYHPGTLIRQPLDKARAWADLCLARSVMPP
jgi:uracil-DNA glycosylase